LHLVLGGQRVFRH